MGIPFSQDAVCVVVKTGHEISEGRNWVRLSRHAATMASTSAAGI
jgi:hypothetical protein